MAVIRSPLPHASYTTLRNCWLRDPRISLKAKGLLGYLSSHAEGYKCSQAQIVRESRDSQDAVRTGLRELEAAGYLSRVPTRSAGRFAEDDYALRDPFDGAGRLLPGDSGEIRLSDAGDGREIHQSGFSAPGKPGREIRPIEEQGEKTKGVPTEPPAAGQLALVPPHDPFDDFWKVYPRKVGKDAARRAWGKALRRAEADVIVAACAAYPFDRSRPQFIPHPSTWLNDGRWQDDPAAVAAGNRSRNVPGSNYGPRYMNPDPTDPANRGAFDGAF